MKGMVLCIIVGKQMVDVLLIACSFCQDALHVRKGREKWRKISVSRKNKKKDVIVVNNQDSKMSFNQQDKKVLHVPCNILGQPI
jgi:hypothetical protein